jgi:hypothetical protein
MKTSKNNPALPIKSKLDLKLSIIVEINNEQIAMPSKKIQAFPVNPAYWIKIISSESKSKAMSKS